MGKSRKVAPETYQRFQSHSARTARSTRGTITARKTKPVEWGCSVGSEHRRCHFPSMPGLNFTSLVLFARVTLCLTTFPSSFHFSHPSSEMDPSPKPLHPPHPQDPHPQLFHFWVTDFSHFWSGIPSTPNFSSVSQALLEDHLPPFPDGPIFLTPVEDHVLAS